MILYRQLYDPSTGTHYSIDSRSLVFKIASDEVNKETRLKAYDVQIVSTLFAKHPEPASYQEIFNILKHHKLACPDETRLHRKISQLRACLAKFHPRIDKIICNIRGVGYGLPLHFKEPEAYGQGHEDSFGNLEIQDAMSCLREYVDESIELSHKCSIMNSESGFVLQRKPVHASLEVLLEQYEKQKNRIHVELRLHKADFITIRLEFIFAKLKTYIGLARMSEFSVTLKQWLDWHKIESMQVIQELVDLIKQSQ